ncbi:hypothetical protein CYMTET_7252 [Cymbomonas tetramitiformis]|uniref:Thiamine pyrophosphate enzyme TPP-binding domain-containing protein n=1 Tax=Cymbomonas tetramitiformis TaxID=36881 RepID=A0AAE0GVH6_9CHLO|nr:hypothetical protein CYMTET_7252 [Cymbomonas tetramitiformis]
MQYCICVPAVCAGTEHTRSGAHAGGVQAAEQLNVITVICANNKYAILKLEMSLQRVKSSPAATQGAQGSPSHRNALQTLTDLSNPAIDWVALGSGYGVHSVRATTAESFAQEFQSALARGGPSLIEAQI